MFTTELDLAAKITVVTRMSYSRTKSFNKKKNSYLYGFRTDLDLVVNGKVVTYPIWVHNRAGSCSKWESSYLYPMGSKHG